MAQQRDQSPLLQSLGSSYNSGGCEGDGGARSETGCSLPESQIPYTHSLPPAIPPVTQGAWGCPLMLLLPPSLPSTHPSSSLLPTRLLFLPLPSSLEASVPVTHVWSHQFRWAAHQLLALLHSFIWVKSCSRNVEGMEVEAEPAGEQASLAGLCIPVVSAWLLGPPHTPGILAVCLRQESESTYS